MAECSCTTKKMGFPVIELKRKKEYALDMCAAAGCRRKKTLETCIVEHPKKGVLTVPVCDKHRDGLSVVEEADGGETPSASVEPPGDTTEVRESRSFPYALPPELKLGLRLQFEPSLDDLQTLAQMGMSVTMAGAGEAPHYVTCKANPAQEYMVLQGKSAKHVAAAAYKEETEVQEDMPLQQEIAEELQDTQAALQEIGDFAVASAEDEEFVGELLRDVKSKNNALEAKKKRATAPLNASLKEIRSWFKPAQQALSQLERELKSKVITYHRQLAAEREAELRKLREAKSLEAAKAAQVAITQAQTPTTASIRVSKRWDFEVNDLSLVPREYLTLDTSAVRAAIRDGARDILGLTIHQVETVSSMKG